MSMRISSARCPDGGNPAALGYAEASSIPFGFGIIRNHYVGRTFIQPTQTGRQRSISRKHAPNRPLLEGKRVVLVDDSIVRGNTSQRIVQMIRDAGASEIHFRVASPPIKHPDFYGIDMPSKEELIASSMSIDQMKRYLKVDSLAFISLPGFYEALGQGKRVDARRSLRTIASRAIIRRVWSIATTTWRRRSSSFRCSTTRGFSWTAASFLSPAPPGASAARLRWSWRRPAIM
jgi:glutamine phosphoribosylpyrophosphate amidotransferase